MAAVTCILAPLSIPIGPVPISFTNLAIYLSLYLLGWKKGTISYLIYLLIGLVGLPVFSGFHWWSGEIGRAYRWIYHRIYRNGSHCRTVHRQLPQTI
jgi:biotin transporter BioY